MDNDLGNLLEDEPLESKKKLKLQTSPN